MANILEVVETISNIVSTKGRDGSLDEDGNRVEIGLRREQGHLINDSRVMDGFGVKFSANNMIVSYHSMISLKEFHNNDFEGDIEEMLESIVKFLKKEYKKAAGSSLSLKMTQKPVVCVENSSNVRSWVNAHCIYEIQGINDMDPILGASDPKRMSKNFKNWVSTQEKEGKRPENVTFKKGANQQE